MPPVAVLGPIALPLLAAAVVATLGLAGFRPGRGPAAAGAWASAMALFVVWLPVRSSIELVLGQLGFGSALDLRIDAVSFAFALMVVLPAAVLLTLQPRPWPEAAIGLVGVSAAVAALEAGGVVLTAIAGGTAATLAIVLLETEDPDAHRPSWALLLAGWLALSLAGVTLQATGGTAVYAAVPVSSETPALFTLLVASALLASCLLPWRLWPTQLWTRPSLRAAGIATATLYPLGFYGLVRGYELGSGRYPSPAFNVLLALLGIAVAVMAAVRAQAAQTRREFLAELLPGFGGFALISIALGTPLGLVAGVVMLAAASAFVACIALLPDRAGPAALVTIAAAIGLPPGITFGARVLGVEATFEAGDFVGLIGLVATLTWALWVVAGARATGLPGGGGHPATETYPFVAMAIAGLTFVAGPAMALFQSGFANPVAAEVMRTAAGSLSGGLSSVVTVSSLLPVVTLFAPALVIAIAAYALANTSAISTQARPALFRTPSFAELERLRSGLRRAAVPEQYRSLFSFRALEKAAAGGRPVLWLVALVALGFAVTRF